MAKATGQTPPTLLGRPRLERRLWPYLDVYGLLSSSREFWENGPHAIRISEITSLLRFKRLHRGDTGDRWLRYIKQLDNVYLKHSHKKRARQ